jgi:hypothetical protein
MTDDDTNAAKVKNNILFMCLKFSSSFGIISGNTCLPAAYLSVGRVGR